MEKVLKARSANFTREETFRLTELVAHHFKIKENKKTDAVTWHEKESRANHSGEYQQQQILFVVILFAFPLWISLCDNQSLAGCSRAVESTCCQLTSRCQLAIEFPRENTCCPLSRGWGASKVRAFA
jgi:hypothetical protein